MDLFVLVRGWLGWQGIGSVGVSLVALERVWFIWREFDRVLEDLIVGFVLGSDL